MSRDWSGSNNPKYKHGERKNLTPEYYSWRNMRNRCNNSKSANYDYYGGRGIKVCERWNNSFQDFLEDMGRKPTPTHTLDRIDNNGDYTKENCRWADKVEQGRNKRNNRFFKMEDGRILTVSDAARELGLSVSTVWFKARANK